MLVAVDHTEIQRQTARNRVMEGNPGGSAVGFHAEGRRQKMYRVGDLPAQWQGVQRQQQTANGVFPSSGVLPWALSPSASTKRP